MGIPIENIKPGMGLVMLRGPLVREGIGAYGIETEYKENRWLQGALLIALAVSPPYVVCRVLSPSEIGRSTAQRKASPFYIFMGTPDDSPTQDKTASIDTRQFELGAASQQFVAAFIANETPGPQPGQLP